MTALGGLRAAGRSLTTVAKLGFGAAPGRTTLFILVDLSRTGFALASIYAIKFIVEEASAHQVVGAIRSAAVLAFFAGASAIAYIGYLNLLPKMTELVRLRLDNELIRLTNRIPTIEYHDRPAFADKLHLIRQTRQTLVSSVQFIGIVSNTLLGSLGAIAIMASIEPRFLLLPLFAIPRLFAGSRAQQLTRTAQDSAAEPMRLRAHLYTKVASAAAGKEIRVFGLQAVLTDRFRALTLKIQRLRDRGSWGGTGWLLLGDVTFVLAYVAALAWVVVRVARREAGVGDFVVIATMIATLVAAVNGVAVIGQSVPLLLLTIERFHWLEDYVQTARAPAAGPKPSAPSKVGAGIQMDGVSFAYPDRDGTALSDISLNLPTGRVVALVGENGSGKSTLVKLLCGFYRPTAGRILIDGRDLADTPIELWRSKVTAAFQDYVNYEFLLRENVGVGELALIGRRDLVSEALERAGGAALAELQPNGIDTMLGRRWGGADLSGGQWQKLALARALIREEPQLVIFDEPTAALDAAAEHEMFAKFAAEARSSRAARRVTLIISHRFSTVRMADSIAVLDKGRLAEFGSHKELMAQDGLYRELFELQAKAYR